MKNIILTMLIMTISTQLMAATSVTKQVSKSIKMAESPLTKDIQAYYNCVKETLEDSNYELNTHQVKEACEETLDQIEKTMYEIYDLEDLEEFIEGTRVRLYFEADRYRDKKIKSAQ